MISITKFGTKLMSASKSPNKIPLEYLKVAQNLRIYDGGIGPRRGFSSILDSTIGTKNKGGFVLNGELYQITNSKIYLIDKTAGTQTEVADLGHDTLCDIATYGTIKGNFVSLNSDTYDYDTDPEEIGRIQYNENANELQLRDTSGTPIVDQFTFTPNIEDYDYPVVRINFSGTTGGVDSGTGKLNPAGDGYLIEDGEYMQLSSTQDEGSLSYDIGYYETEQHAIIVADGEKSYVFDGTSILTEVPFPKTSSGIIGKLNNKTLLAKGNIMYVSKGSGDETAENMYDYADTNNQVNFSASIKGLEANKYGAIITLEDDTAFYMDSSSLQTIADAPTYIASPLGAMSYPINPFCMVKAGDKTFSFTHNLTIETVNYIGGTDSPTIGELSNIPVVGIKELLLKIDREQPYGYATYNINDKTVQFHLRTVNSQLNDVVILYDLINETFSYDTNKFYNYVVKDGIKYYGFSDVNSSIYEDNVGYTDNGVGIPVYLKTQRLNSGRAEQDLFVGFHTAGAISNQTILKYKASIDGSNVFNATIEETSINNIGGGDIGGDDIGGIPIGGPLTYEDSLNVFDKTADRAYIYKMGKGMIIEIESSSQVNDFILDKLEYDVIATEFSDLNNKF